MSIEPFVIRIEDAQLDDMRRRLRATRWAPRQLSGRGLSYWTDGKGDDRVVYVTTGYRLVSLNAKTGQPVAGFGTNGVVDLKQGIMINGKQADLEKSEIGSGHGFSDAGQGRRRRSRMCGRRS